MERKRLQLLGAAFAGLLALTLGLFTYSTRAADTGRLFVFGPASATCERTGQTATAGFQNSSFGVELQNFWAQERVAISITFPDGRVFSPSVAQLADNNSLLPYNSAGVRNGLDGVIDMPANVPYVQPSSVGGDYYARFTITSRWPYGCYTLTARGLGSSRQAQSSFVVTPRVGAAPNPGQATLTIQDNTTGDQSSQQGAIVNIFGRGFVARELISIWMTAPDGTVTPYPYQPVSSDIGSFAETFTFNALFPTGVYKFTALGNQSGYQVIADFNLTSRPSNTSGWAQLRVAFPADTGGAQRTFFEVQGKRYNPGERVDIWMTLPDGAVRGLPSQFANEFGEFYAVLYLDERLPVGEYDFTGKGASSGFLVITTLFLERGSPNVLDTTPLLIPAPVVVDSNTGAPLGGPDTLGSPPALDPPPTTFVEPTF
jgi:hypothetical protein